MTTTTVAMTTTPCTAGMSLLSIAFAAAWPRPGSAKSCSITTDPPNRAMNWMPSTETTGPPANRRAWT